MKGEGTQDVSYIFEGFFKGGNENVSLHVEGILKTLLTQTTPGGDSEINFTFQGNPKECILHFDMVPP